jgi:hypothetical protein
MLQIASPRIASGAGGLTTVDVWPQIDLDTELNDRGVSKAREDQADAFDL